jgi:23S rRNA (cytidine1920-2'-O)/16S rRNA (cytidine1409-2'-O)-methyltransferase
VIAIDVGHGQLHERLREDPRVDVRERTHVRDVTLDEIGDPVEVLVADLSFISLRSVLPGLIGLCAPEADIVVLVKPQFEAGRDEASRGGGVIRDPAVHERVVNEVVGALERLGSSIMGTMRSPITGAEGNVEFLVHARAPGPRRR